MCAQAFRDKIRKKHESMDALLFDAEPVLESGRVHYSILLGYELARLLLERSHIKNAE